MNQEVHARFWRRVEAKFLRGPDNWSFSVALPAPPRLCHKIYGRCDFLATSIAGTAADPPIADRDGTHQLLPMRMFVL